MLHSSLPVSLTPFVGRTKELSNIAALLADPNCHLLTLVGPGGIGKTRLAIEAARRLSPAFAQGAYFVPLVSLSLPEAMIPAIADAIGLTFFPGVELKQQLLEALRNRHLLLVLDNLEHLLAGANLLLEISQSAPDVKLLITSRERLNVQGETLFHVKGMDYPADEYSENTLDYGAVKLLLDNLRRIQPELALTDDALKEAVHICRQVQGMPLALILAAGWSETLTLPEISHEIARSLDILETTMRDVPERHRNMHAVFDPSWQMLSQEERAVFMKLSVFRGGFSREAAQQVAGATLPIIASLVNKSLIVHEPTGRYQIHELLGQYAQEKLNDSAGESEAVHHLHCAYFGEFMARAWERLKSSQQIAALKEIEVEYGNLLAAWHFMVQRGKAAAIRQSADSLSFFLDMRSRRQEAIDLFGQAAEALRGESGEDAAIALGGMLQREGWFYNGLGQPEKGRALAEEGLAILRGYDCPEDRIAALVSLTLTADYANDMPRASQAALEALHIARENGDRWRIMEALYWLGCVYNKLQKYQETWRIVREAFEIAQEFGDYWYRGCIGGLLLSETAFAMGDYAEARMRCEEGLICYETLGQPWAIASVCALLGDIAVTFADYAEARHYYQRCIRLFIESDQTWEALNTLMKTAHMLIAQSETLAAVELVTFILQQSTALKTTRDVAERLLADLQPQLPPEIFRAAQQRGAALSLDAAVQRFLDDVQSAPSRPDRFRSQTMPLSARELEVLSSIADGLSNAEIAKKLYLSVGTVKVHVRHIFDKLDVNSRTQAIAIARQTELL